MRSYHILSSFHVSSYIRSPCAALSFSSAAVMYRTAHLYRPLSRAIAKSQARSYAKEIVFGENARSSMLTGVETLARAVSATLGPKVRH